MVEYTHYGWFYFVPIVFVEVDGGGCKMKMRWTGWFWPVVMCAYVHNAFSAIHGVESDFPIRIKGRLK